VDSECSFIAYGNEDEEKGRLGTVLGGKERTRKGGGAMKRVRGWMRCSQRGLKGRADGPDAGKEVTRKGGERKEGGSRKKSGKKKRAFD